MPRAASMVGRSMLIGKLDMRPTTVQPSSACNLLPSEFAYCAGEFERWLDGKDKAGRQEFLGSLVSLICDNVSGVFGGSFVRGVFEQLSPAQQNELRNSPYFPSLQVCFTYAAHRARDLNEKVHVYVAHQPEFAPEVASHYAFIKKALDAPRVTGIVDAIADRIDSFTIQESSIVPLQVADLVSYEVYKETRRHVDANPLPMRWPLKQFTTRCNGRIDKFVGVEAILACLPKSVGGTAG